MSPVDPRRPALLLAFGLLVPFAAQASEDELEMGRFIAAEPRPHRLVHEFRGTFGVLPVDSFQLAITLGGSYALHLSDVWAWEAISFDYAVNVDTGVEDTLASRWSIATAFERAPLQYLVGTNALITPLYGKLAVLDEEIIYADAHVAIGGGVAHYSDGFRAQVSVSPGFRIFLGSILSLRLDVRGALIPNAPGGTDFLVGVNLSLSSTFGSLRVTEAKEERAPRKLVDGLEVLDRLYPEKDPESSK